MPDDGPPPRRRRKLPIVAVAIAAFAVGGVSRCGGDQSKFADDAPQKVESAYPAETPTVGPALALTPEQRIQCHARLEDLATTGLIKGRPTPRRADVDEAVWAALSYHEKDAVLAALSCDVFGQAAPPEGESAVIHGWHSGEKLRELTASGVV